MKKPQQKPAKKPISPKQATLDQLKVAVYDRLAAVQQLQREIAELNAEIGVRTGAIQPPKPSKNGAGAEA